MMLSINKVITPKQTGKTSSSTPVDYSYFDKYKKKKGEKLSFLLPFNWLLLGVIVFTLNVVKIPGRIFGVIRIVNFKA